MDEGDRKGCMGAESHKSQKASAGRMVVPGEDPRSDQTRVTSSPGTPEPSMISHIRSVARPRLADDAPCLSRIFMNTSLIVGRRFQVWFSAWSANRASRRRPLLLAHRQRNSECDSGR